MTKSKHYLPAQVLSFNVAEVGESLVENGTAIAERMAPSHVKVPPFMKRCLPLCALLTLMCGSAVFGFSFLVVPDQSIGYYTPSKSCHDCTLQLYVPGTYLSLPWSRGTFKVVDVSDRNLTVGVVDEFRGTCVVECKVTNTTDYVYNFHRFGEDSAQKFDDLLIGFARSVFKNLTMGSSYRRYGVQFQNGVEVNL